jgi:hypothetical protein
LLFPGSRSRKNQFNEQQDVMRAGGTKDQLGGCRDGSVVGVSVVTGMEGGGTKREI